MTGVPDGALRGLRVLDLTHALAGSFCSQLLADHGADVIKVEPPEGDFFRRVGPFLEDDEQRSFGGLFQACNRNKRSVAINLKDEQGRALLEQLVLGADALVENYRAGVLERIGLGYESLHVLKPSLVYTSIRGFGDRAGGASPYMNWPAFDIVAQAMGGWMGITGEDAEHPVKVGGGAGDTVSGLFAAFGTMAALWHARATGEGQYVDVAMTDSILALSELVVSQYSYRGVSPQPMGNGIPGMSLFGTIRARDGMIAIAACHDPQFRVLCELIGRTDLLADPRFTDEEGRWKHDAALRIEVEAFTRLHTKEELKALFGEKVPFSPIYTAAEIFADSHFSIREMLPKVEQPGSSRSVAVPGVPVKLSRTPGAVRHRAPLLGEHTRAVLAEIGLSNLRIDELAEAGAIRLASRS